MLLVLLLLLVVLFIVVVFFVVLLLLLLLRVSLLLGLFARLLLYAVSYASLLYVLVFVFVHDDGAVVVDCVYAVFCFLVTFCEDGVRVWYYLYCYLCCC